MNTLTIERRLSRSPLTKRFFLGVFACDRVPPIHKFPSSFVLNLDPSSEGGSHWVSVFAVSPHKLYYFDSYGMAPNECVRKSLGQFSKITRNTRVFQSLNSNICGHYSMLFIALSSMGVHFDRIIKLLLARSRNRDNYVKSLTNKLV